MLSPSFGTIGLWVEYRFIISNQWVCTIKVLVIALGPDRGMRVQDSCGHCRVGERCPRFRCAERACSNRMVVASDEMAHALDNTHHIMIRNAPQIVLRDHVEGHQSQ